MSDATGPSLDEILADLTDPGPKDGVRILAAGASLLALQAATSAAGWTVVQLPDDGDGAPSDPEDRRSVIRALGRALQLPEWFGANYDALADALSDVVHQPGTLLVWHGWDALAQADRTAFVTLVQIFADRAQSTRRPPLRVVLA